MALPPAEDVENRLDILHFGLWNNRINVLYDVGDMGNAGLPLLVYASQDADWQVRLTAVHFMGKLGAPASAALGEIARVEPCPRVRISAMRWLANMGPAGQAILGNVMTPEDERQMASLPDRYGTERMGKPLVIDAPGGYMTPEFFNHGPDARVCRSSEYADHREHRLKPAAVRAPTHAQYPAATPVRRAKTPSPNSFEPVVTPQVRLVPAAPAERERLPESPLLASVLLIEPEIPDPRTIELKKRAGSSDKASLPRNFASAIASPSARQEAPPPRVVAKQTGVKLADARTPGQPETLPRAGPGNGPRESWSPAVRSEAVPERGKPLVSLASRARQPAAETMPAAPPGIHREPTESGLASVVDDAGTGKPENDPIPELIKRLSSAEPRTRARAADELGKRGPAALPAVPALRQALKDRDRRVRASAVLALGSVGTSIDGVVGEIRRALRDKNEDVRFSASIALERLGGAQGAPAYNRKAP